MPSSPLSSAPFRRTVLWVLLALLPLWLGGMLGRGFWTPDEPREADIAWNMSRQPDLAVPRLAGEAFLEKPPLLYWAAAPWVGVFGPAPWATRLPNLLYAGLATLLIAALGWQMAGATAAWVAGLVSGSFLLALQVAVWFATDAPLVAGVALALFGLWNGLQAAPGRRKFVSYLAMHAGLALAFFAKNAAGWMIPVLTLATWVVWQRRWRELLARELWAASLLLAALIGPWIWAIATGPQGRDNLLAFFWFNLAGRFTDVGAPADIAYASAHSNSFGKYFLEAPVNLLPWSLLAIAACRRAWQVLKPAATPPMTPPTTHAPAAWQFAVAAWVPSLLLLSVSTTARAVYAAPLLPGLALLLGLWAAGPLRSMDGIDRKLLRGSALLTGALLLINLLILPVMVTARSIEHQSAVPTVLLTVAGGLLVVLLARQAWRLTGESRILPAIRWIYAAFALWLLLTGLSTFAAIDRAQNLAAIVHSVGTQLGRRPLILYRPDETTRAILDLYLPSAQHASIDTARDREQLRARLQARPDALVLIKLPNYSAGPVRNALTKFGIRERAARSDADLQDLTGTLRLQPAGEHGTPDGRRYLLLRGPADR